MSHHEALGKGNWTHVKAECHYIREPVWVHAGAIDDRGYSFASSTYRVREAEKFAYGLYWFRKSLW